MEYRKDIQILRGVAVLLVVFFHFEIAGFTSGFLGVDVFFVISGYLMAKLYDPSRKRDFFVKRARRLLPAYFAVVAVTALIAAARTIPS
ncbi:MAG TPA: acyltransferase, partial [Steroidobacteraceae bacterium]|nr:acyltransferase [Steroidobacteraceae bacterium]